MDEVIMDGMEICKTGAAFYIGKKSRDWYSYRASPEEKEKVLQALSKNGIFVIPEYPGNCISRIILTVDGEKYTLHQEGCRLMPLEAAREIAMKMGECAAINTIGAVTHPKRKPVPYPAQAVPENMQMSLF